MIKITTTLLEPYLKGQKKHAAYETTVDIADHLKFHFDGYCYRDESKKERKNPYFKYLIDERRPSESDHIREYRRKIYLPVTKQPCFKVLNSLKKIVKSSDWNINWTKVNRPGRVRDGEQLEDYDKNIPHFKSLENWLYSFGMKEILSDPNGLICVLPVYYDVEGGDFRKPYPYFIPSEDVYEYKEGELAIFKSKISYEYESEDKSRTLKDFVIIAVSKTEVWEAKKKNAKGEWEVKQVMDLKFNKMPAFRAGGIFKEVIDNSPVYESFVSPILSGLDAAAREVSDLDAEVVQHIFSTMWYYAAQGCASCQGTGKVLKQGIEAVCGSCDGHGVMVKSPYKDIVVKPGTLDEQTPKPPFAGYVEKNTEIVKIQDERIDKHIYKALSSINMEFLAQTPLNESGKAKEVDRDELNNFVYGVAYHLVEHVLKNSYYFINEERVMDLGLPETIKAEMLPAIPVPERYEILSENYLLEKAATAREKQLDPLIVSTEETDYINKKYENYPEIREKIKTIKELDPFPSMTPEQKDAGLLAGTMLKNDVILSKYIVNFVERATQEDEEFLNKEYMDKLKIIQGYTDEKIQIAEAEQKKKDQANRKLLIDEINNGQQSGQAA